MIGAAGPGSAPRSSVVLVDALSARLGGGMSYLTNQLQALERVAPDLELLVLAAPANAAPLRAALRAPIRVVGGGALRPLVEQVLLPWLGRSGGVIYCPGNFAPLAPTRTRVVLTVQNPNYFGAGRHASHNRSIDRRVRSRLARLSAARADRLVVISEALQHDVAADLPAVAGRADLVPSGGPVWGDAARRPTSLAPGADDFVLVLSNDAPHKHVDAVVAAWVTAATTAPTTPTPVTTPAPVTTAAPVVTPAATGAAAPEPARAPADTPHLVIAGGFFDPARATRQRAMVPHDLQHRFHQLGAIVDRGEVRWLLEQARALVSMASLEAHPLTPAEAGSRGCPLVLSDIPAHREVAGDHARYVRPGHHRALADALADVFATAPARARWTWPVTWDDNADQLAAILRAELDAAPRSGGRHP